MEGEVIVARGLVTGTGSFAGASVALALAEKSASLTAHHRSRTIWSDLLSRHPSITVISGDLNHDRVTLRPDGGLDYVVNCAAATTATDTATLVKDNIDATRRLIGAVLETDCRLWIQMSTVSVHGANTNGSISRTSPIVEPLPYGASKRVAEALLEEASDRFAVRCLRLPAILGAGARGHWPSRVLNAANFDDPVTIFNPEKPFNNAVHIDDLSAFVDHLTEAEHVGFDAFPIASTDPITVAQAAQTLIDSAGSGTVVTIDNSPRPSFYVDDAYARSSYGYASRSTYAALRDYARLARYARPGDDIGEKRPGPQ